MPGNCGDGFRSGTKININYRFLLPILLMQAKRKRAPTGAFFRLACRACFYLVAGKAKGLQGDGRSPKGRQRPLVSNFLTR
ncbi:hypothetical protein SPACI_044840 [Sporomusa acidovorans DSM 3132]|uniref:Uncharacterized protein n=1 Tax=Sporomusa acidovorans (strain ATCC 49682 / DSM 3132 / Mol) TaxID=1123286 RepID=A0ABZ3J7K7_SPOA4|nr:hypothetical protein SPACI_41170 [Sporomusa acidovorans DSM 3132]SDE07364.1 hypothetical protein SAMN04488499_1007106 [Sporomusa acidovorans]